MSRRARAELALRRQRRPPHPDPDGSHAHTHRTNAQNRLQRGPNWRSICLLTLERYVHRSSSSLVRTDELRRLVELTSPLTSFPSATARVPTLPALVHSANPPPSTRPDAPARVGQAVRVLKGRLLKAVLDRPAPAQTRGRVRRGKIPGPSSSCCISMGRTSWAQRD